MKLFAKIAIGITIVILMIITVSSFIIERPFTGFISIVAMILLFMVVFND